MLKWWVLVFALSAAFALVKSNRAFAAEPSCQLPIPCVARFTFNTCTRPPRGKPLLTMRVTDVSRVACSQQIVKLKPENAAAYNLPEEIEMEFDGYCLSFDGKIGDTIPMALREEHSVSTRRYSMACSPALDLPTKRPPIPK